MLAVHSYERPASTFSPSLFVKIFYCLFICGITLISTENVLTCLAFEEFGLSYETGSKQVKFGHATVMNPPRLNLGVVVVQLGGFRRQILRNLNF